MNEDDDLNEAFADSNQEEMHKTLKSHGWKIAKFQDEKKKNASYYNVKGKEHQEWLKKNTRNPKDNIRYSQTTRRYTHPDRPHEHIETNPGGDQYNTWVHHKGLHAKDHGGGIKLLGGTRGKSGKRHELENHLKSGAKINEEAPANAAGGGGVAGIGVGADGEPGVTPNAQKKYQKKNKAQAVIPFRTFMRNAEAAKVK